MARYSMLPVVLLALLPLALARPEDAVSAARPRRPTSAADELQKWTGCEKQCEKEPCSQCGEEDISCTALCYDSCECGCVGHPAGGGNYTATIEYFRALEGCSAKCDATADKCVWDCSGLKDCKDACLADKFKCECDCLDEAQAAVTRTTLSITSYMFGAVLLAFVIVVFVGLTLLKINNKK